VGIFIAFAILFTMAAMVKVPLERMADPTDTTYIPRPDWYFLFLFQLLRLKVFAGEFGQFLGAIALPGAFMALLAALPFIDRDPERNIFKRPIALISWIVVMASILIFTVAAIINREFLE
jgi:ubiquinol-cytochrome c reductase cytochrome b subunit